MVGWVAHSNRRRSGAVRLTVETVGIRLSVCRSVSERQAGSVDSTLAASGRTWGDVSACSLRRWVMFVAQSLGKIPAYLWKWQKLPGQKQTHCPSCGSSFHPSFHFYTVWFANVVSWMMNLRVHSLVKSTFPLVLIASWPNWNWIPISINKVSHRCLHFCCQRQQKHAHRIVLRAILIL